MKTSIALKTLIASLALTSVSALPVPRVGEYESKYYCLKSWQEPGVATHVAGFCDEAENNFNNARPVNIYGCTADQVVLYTDRNVTNNEEFSIIVKSCRPVTDGAIQPVQL